MQKLNLGCGYNHKIGFCNVDNDASCSPDQVVDLESFPWPWATDSVSEIVWEHSLEHLGESTERWKKIIQEMYRVSTNQALIKIIVPHPNHDTFLIDPTHVRAILPESFLMFDQLRNIEDGKRGGRETKLGLQWDVDFQMSEVQYVFEEPWQSQYNRGENIEGVRQDLARLKNVCREIHFAIRVMKPGRGKGVTSNAEKIFNLPERVPQHILHTLEWLVKCDNFSMTRELVFAVAKYLPPEDSSTTDFIAQYLHRAKFYKEAVAYAEKTAAVAPDSIPALFNLAKCLHSAARTAEAEVAMRRVCESRPEWIDAKIDLSVYICSLGRRDEGMNLLLEAQKDLKANDPNRAVIDFNLGWHYLRKGEFKRGMRSLTVGRSLRIWGAWANKYSQPVINATTNLEGKTVLLVGEGGAGDEVINCRFAKVIEERGGRAIWLSHQKLESIIGRHPNVYKAIAKTDYEKVTYDYWAPSMDLPAILDLELAELPNAPYLRADPEYVKKWQSLIPKNGKKLKVGLRWQGNRLYEQDLLRAVPFRELFGATHLDHVELYSLQRDDGVEELEGNLKVKDLSPHLLTWEDTAAAISQLDLVISTCTSVPHLAAAMGKPTWLLCPLNMYYIWATPGDTSQWYPSIRLFRQTQYLDWQDVLNNIREELTKLALSSAKSDAVFAKGTPVDSGAGGPEVLMPSK